MVRTRLSTSFVTLLQTALAWTHIWHMCVCCSSCFFFLFFQRISGRARHAARGASDQHRFNTHAGASRTAPRRCICTATCLEACPGQHLRATARSCSSARCRWCLIASCTRSAICWGTARCGPRPSLCTSKRPRCAAAGACLAALPWCPTSLRCQAHTLYCCIQAALVSVIFTAV